MLREETRNLIKLLREWSSERIDNRKGSADRQHDAQSHRHLRKYPASLTLRAPNGREAYAYPQRGTLNSYTIHLSGDEYVTRYVGRVIAYRNVLRRLASTL